MNGLGTGESLYVPHLRVVSSGLDAATTRLRIAGLFGSLSLRSTDLPSSAILCIRSISDPRPDTLRLQPGAKMDPGWEEALEAVVSRHLRRAMRPIRESIPANAEAVLFADRGELLACLAVDWMKGELANRWWWRSMMGDLDPPRNVLGAWLQAPWSIPSALEHLACREQLRAFARLLSGSEARRLHEALIVAFGLHELRSALRSPSARSHHASGVTPTSDVDGTPVSLPRAVSRAQTPQPRPEPAPPWAQWVPEADFGEPDVDVRFLLGIGLLVQRSASIVRSASFAAKAAAWYQGCMSSCVAPRHAPTSAAQGAAVRVRAEAGRPPDSSMPPFDSRDAKPRAPVSSPHAEYASTRPALDAPVRPTDGPTPETPGQSGRRATSERRPRASPQRLGERTKTRELPHVSEQSIETELGGLFYLINLAICLGLYSDFTSPLEPGLPLAVWDFIALVGSRLLGKRLPEDPVWSVLARLAGRDREVPPGASFEPPAEWRIPPEWLAPFADGAQWSWCEHRHRLRAFHPAGFCVFDVRFDGEVKKRLHREMAAYRQVAVRAVRRVRSQPMKLETPLDRWLGWLVPFLVARLQRAPGFGPQGDPVGLLIHHRARIVIGTDRLDLVFALADLPVEVRVAGLDRDPGWVPAAGRFVSFHYVDE